MCRRWTKGQLCPGGTAGDSVRFVTLLRTVRSGKLITVYFWNFLLSIAGLRLKASNKPRKAKPQVRGSHCRKGRVRSWPRYSSHCGHTGVFSPGLHSEGIRDPGGVGGAGGHLVALSGSHRWRLVSKLWSGALGRDRPKSGPLHLTKKDRSMTGKKISAFQAKPKHSSRIFFSYSISLYDDLKETTPNPKLANQLTKPIT